MKKYNCNKINSNIEYTMVILTENDILNECNDHCGFGFEILILPAKYENVHSNYLDNIILVVEARNGDVIYV